MNASDDALRLALSFYIGEVCQGCGRSFDTIESLENAVWWPWEKGRVGHKECFDTGKSVEPIRKLYIRKLNLKGP